MRKYNFSLELEQFIARHCARWRDLLVELIGKPSPFGDEHEAVACLRAALNDLGAPVTEVIHDPSRLRSLPQAQRPIIEGMDRKSLVVVIKGAGSGKSLCLSAHLDTVPLGDPAAWRHPPPAAWIDPKENLVYGRGAVDDKAGVVVLFGVLETLLRLPLQLKGDLVVHFVLEDEITGNGTLLCLESGFTADAALIVDGTRLENAISEHAGHLEFAITFFGKPASVSVSHMGINAAEIAAKWVAHIKSAVEALNSNRDAPWTIFPSPFQCIFLGMEATEGQFTVPDQAKARFHAVYCPPWKLAEFKAMIEREAEKFSSLYPMAGPPQLSYEGYQSDPVGASSPELERTLVQTAERTGLGRISIGPSTGLSDLRHFANRGIPCLLYGPGRGMNAHRADEHYFLEDLPRMVRLYTEICLEWCARA
jgi:acetylornithine deacetylase